MKLQQNNRQQRNAFFIPQKAISRRDTFALDSTTYTARFQPSHVIHLQASIEYCHDAVKPTVDVSILDVGLPEAQTDTYDLHNVA